MWVLLSSYLFLAEHDVIVQRIKEVMPGAVKRYAGLIKKDVRKVIGGYFMAQFKIMFVVALVLMGGLMLLGVHYWAVRRWPLPFWISCPCSAQERC